MLQSQLIYSGATVNDINILPLVLYRESYEIGRGCSNIGAVKQGRTLRLLANAFLEWDRDTHWQKALNAVGKSVCYKERKKERSSTFHCGAGLANSEHSHPAGLLLKASILLCHEGSSERLNQGELKL